MKYIKLLWLWWRLTRIPASCRFGYVGGCPTCERHRRLGGELAG